ncbi:SurA N-terminal domain-containing protein [Thiomicrorhabdus lithotrophica]|uniref:Periplasmic chaperone PpiD n=1 Tax=Thiomicrorhabdus lithotrophica TaxID=2949997 RepID=A0ABY8CC79_9GAMM|nr:SurA N-terminal domain-containing protein [Thiomicrorhabdus lithotrophica]WEJ63596.1 SurA N-terminal domain-containing protein [Thiomicrorhabdus lithotrophica]
MLQAIRDHAQGWIAWVIVGLIILTFALFGIDQYARGDKVVVVAEVNGEDINANQFLTLYNRQQQRLQQQFGDLYDQVVKDEDLRDQVLDALIESEQIRQWAADNGMVISDQQLATAIHSADVFQQDGKFSQKIYEDVLLRNGLNVARFEYEQRQFLSESQYRNLTQGSSFATASEVEQLALLQGQERNVNYLRVDQRPFLKTVSISDEEISESYQKDLAEYVEPEKVSIDYIELSQAKLADKIAVTDEIIEAYYAENKGQFTLPEKRQAKHILITLESDTSEGIAAAEKTVAEVQAKLAAGESFEDLAKTYSKDPGSAETGGDLGTFEQGMMVPEFDEAVFTMQEGQVSEPVKTEFGYHLIKLVKIVAKKAQPLADVKEEVTKQYQMQEAERQYFDLLEQLNTIVYEQSDSLEPAAEATGLEVKTTEMFSREGGSGELLTNSKVLNTAFSDDVLKSKLNSASIEISANNSVVIRVNNYQKSRQKGLEEVSASIKEELTRQAAIAESEKLGSELLAKINAGEAPESLMKDGVEWNTVGWIARNAQNLLPQMVAEAFKTPKPVEGKSSWTQFQLATGDTILLQVTDVKSEALTAEQKAPLKGAFAELFANAELESRLVDLKANSDIVKKEVYKTVK